MKTIALFTCLLISAQGFSQQYKLPNEQVVFSFLTEGNKMMYICKDTNDSYMVYRFGTKDSLEFQFPDTLNKTSWSKFKHYFYLRGGGKANEGMDIDHLSFTNNGFTYTIYSEYTARDEKYQCGIRVQDLNTNKETEIKGLFESRTGSLSLLRDNPLIERGDE